MLAWARPPPRKRISSITKSPTAKIESQRAACLILDEAALERIAQRAEAELGHPLPVMSEARAERFEQQAH